MRMYRTIAVLVALFVTPAVHAIPNGGSPDLSAFGITWSYDAGAMMLTGTGTPAILQPGNLLVDNPMGSWDLSVNITPAGDLLGGSLSITGGIGEGPFNSPLLEASVVAKEFNAGGSSPGIYKFLLKTTGGSLQPQFGPQVAILLNTNEAQQFPGASDFSFMNASSDTFAVPVPEPASAGMMGVAGLLAGGLARRRDRRA